MLMVSPEGWISGPHVDMRNHVMIVGRCLFMVSHEGYGGVCVCVCGKGLPLYCIRP